MSLQLYSLFTFFLLLETSSINVLSFQYKVGDLDSWGVPSPFKSNLYSIWSKNHNFTVGDSLLFLYPPSQDSVIEVTEHAYKICSISDPITEFGDGNSVFNITTPGNFFFVSGVQGHCQKQQKIEIRVASADGKFFPPSSGVVASPAGAPSYQNAFGPMPIGLGGSGSGGSGAAESYGAGRVVGSVICGLVLCLVF